MSCKRKYMQYYQKSKKQKMDNMAKEFNDILKKESERDNTDFEGQSEHEFDKYLEKESESDIVEFEGQSEHEEGTELKDQSNSESEAEVVSDMCTEPDEVREIKEWIVTCKIPQAHSDKLLKILRRRLLPSLPESTKTLLESDIQFEIKKMLVCDGSYGEFVYLGIRETLHKIVDPSLHISSQTIELVINIDGFSPFKSSSIQIWPILVKIYTKEDLYRPFTAAVYAGNGKPNSPKDYLKRFIKEITELQTNGIEINNQHLQIKLKFFVCDSPARSFVKCWVSHVAFAACERCQVLGRKEDGVTVFIETNAQQKTDEDFLQFSYPQSHTSASPLIAIEPPLNMVSQFVLDPMHLLYLGCTKRILEYLLSSSTHQVRLSSVLKGELQRRTTLIQKDIPSEFPRKMRSIDDYSKYKAVEFKFFLLYAAPVVLKEVVSEQVYEHLMLFCIACRLLSKKQDLSSANINLAREYLRRFVEQAPAVYGITFTSLNVHNLIHLCDDVENLGCNLNELSAFPFECYLGEMGRFLRSPYHIFAQYCRRLHEQENIKCNRLNAEPTLTIEEKKKKIVKLKYNGVLLSTEKPNNNVLLKDGSIAVIQEFQKHMNDNVCIIVKTYLRKSRYLNILATPLH